MKKRKAAIKNRRRDGATERTPGTQGALKKRRVNMVPVPEPVETTSNHVFALIATVRGHMAKHPVLLASCQSFLAQNMRFGDTSRWPREMFDQFQKEWATLVDSDLFVRDIVEWHIKTCTTAHVAYIATTVAFFAATEAWSKVWTDYNIDRCHAIREAELEVDDLFVELGRRHPPLVEEAPR